MTDKIDVFGRRDFTLRALLAMLAGATITVSGCGSDDGPAAPTTPGPVADKAGTIAANHGHRAVITGAQLTGGGALSLDIRGDATHPHTVQLSADEVVRIRDGQQVSKTSSTDASHAHTVTFN